MSRERLIGEKTLNQSTQIFLGLTLALTILISLGGLAPADSFGHLSSHTLTLLGKYLSYAIVALSVDLIWGYLGILSLGHGAFFALGGYASGMYLMRQIGARGVYGQADLPDFMVFLNWSELPWYWLGSGSLAFTLLLILAAPALAALVFGWPAFSSRVSGVYFSIMTQALTFALMLAFFRNEMGFGGNNGLTGFTTLGGYDLASPSLRVALFAASGLTLMAAYYLCRLVTASRLGRVAVAVRDAESRVRFLGYRVERVQLAVFILSAMLAGLGGALFVPQAGIINPGEFAPLKSIEIVIWVALGGRGRLYGAVIGALVVNYAKTWFTALMPEAWLFALGLMFVLVTIFLPQGLAGLLFGRQRGEAA